MKSLFETADREALLARLEALQTGSTHQWGKMNPAQAVAHCAAALETATGHRPLKQVFLGKILTPFIRSSILSDKPFSRNSPTDPTFVVADQRDLDRERERLRGLIQSLVDRGPDEAGKATHSFFGKLSGAEWGCLMYKHIDHHLQQFGA